LAASSSTSGARVGYERSRFYAPSWIDISALEGKKIYFMDKYNRDFEADLSSLVVQKESASVPERILRNFARPSKAFEQDFGGLKLRVALNAEDISMDGERPPGDGSLLPGLRYFGLTTTDDGRSSEIAYGKTAFMKSFALSESIDMEHRMQPAGTVDPYLGIAQDMLGISSDLYRSGGWNFRAGAAYGLWRQGLEGYEAASHNLAYQDQDGLNRSLGLVAEARFAPKDRPYEFSLGFGILNEFESLLGATMSEGFALSSDARTYYMRLGAEKQISEKVRLFANYSLGESRPGIDGAGLIKGISDIVSDSYALGISVAGGEVGRIRAPVRYGMIASRPLAVTRGTMDIFLPQENVSEHELNYKMLSLNLAPTHRETDVEAFVSLGGQKENLTFGLMQRFNAENIGGQNDLVGIVRYNRGF
jgi:hypothetical protein